MKNLYVIVFTISLMFSCENRKHEEEPKPEVIENIYNKTKAFKTNFKFIIDEQDKNVESYWFHVDNWQFDPCCSKKLRSDGIHGWDISYKKNTKILDTNENYLNDKFVLSIIITDKVKRCSSCNTWRMYRSDTLKFKNIKDSLRIIHYPQDTLTLIKRYYPPGHPKYNKKQ